MIESRGYVRRLGTFDAAMVTVGGIIGGGIFLNPAVVAQRVHTGPLILLTWAVGGVIATIGALCFAELGSRRPEAGGGYVYLREAFGPLPAFLYGWTFFLVVNTGGMAAVAVTFARYATDLAQVPALWVKPVAVGAILLLTWVNCVGIRAGATTQNIFTVLKLAALASVILVGVAAALRHGGALADSAAPTPDLVRVIGVALIPVLFTYGGWAHANNVAGEVKDPVRTLPRAMILGVSLVVIVYVLVNVSYVAVLGASGLAVSLAPASDVMRRVLGPIGATVIGLGIVASTFGFVNLSILSAPRVLQAMAADGLFFRRAAVLHPRYRTPTVALGVQAVWAVVLTVSGTYGQLLDYVVFGDWIFFAAIAATLFIYRTRDPHEVGYRVPGYPVVPALFVVVALFVVASSVRSNPVNALIGSLIIETGIPVFFCWRMMA
ncbi:MAG TPA: amino acid permease [Gemmatimonadaceae bacterium]|nr:amino acid permease [Gemmatimonadaceae bacterium]